MRLSSIPASRQFFGICTGAILAFMGFSMTDPLVPLMVTDLGASPRMLGVLMSLTSIGSCFTAIPAGMLVQHYGTRIPIIMGCILSALSCLFLYFFPSFRALLCGLTIYNIAKIILIVAAQAHVGNLGEGRDASRDFGRYAAATSVGQLIGPSISGLIFDHYGGSFLWLFVSIFLLITAVAFFVLIDSGKTSKAHIEIKGSSFSFKINQVKKILDFNVVVAILSSFIAVFANGVRGTFFPVYIRGIGYSAFVVGVMISIRALTSIVVRCLMPRIINLIGGRHPALIFSLFALAVGLGSTSFCHSLWALAINSMIVGLGMGLALPLGMATVSEGVPPKGRGLALGIRLTGNKLANILNPLFFGLVTQWWGFSLAFMMGGIILISADLPIFFYWKRKQKSNFSTRS